MIWGLRPVLIALVVPLALVLLLLTLTLVRVYAGGDVETSTPICAASTWSGVEGR